MLVRELMTPKVYSCTQSDSANRAAQLMWEHDIGCVPVVNGVGHVVGMVTDRDIALAAYFGGTHLSDISVTEIMSKTTYACEGGTSLKQAVATMRYLKLRRLPVLDSGGKLLGVITWSDIVRACVAHRSGEPAPLDDHELANLFSHLSHPPHA